MKLDKWCSALCAFLLAFSLSFSCVNCIITAFKLSILVDYTALAVYCAVFSAVCCALFTLRWTFIVPLLMMALAFLGWKYGSLEWSIKTLLHTISREYHNGYGWGILSWSVDGLQSADFTAAFMLIATLISSSVSWTVCQRRPCFVAIAGTLIPFILCTFLLKTVPDETWLLIWLMSLLLLLLTQARRRQKPREANKLTLFLLLPLLIAGFTLHHYVPKKDYKYRDLAEKWLASIQSLFEDEVPFRVSGNSESVELSQVGPLENTNEPVMYVSSGVERVYYLRGRAYDTYTGTLWKDSEKRNDLPWPHSGMQTDTLKIRTKEVEPLIYIPYFSDPDYVYKNQLINDQSLQRYEMPVYSILPYGLYSSYPVTPLYDHHSLTYLPTHVKQWAEQTLKQIDGYADWLTEEDLGSLILEYVSTSARYRLNTPKIPSDCTNFAQWFLEESDTGYCVHFATAAAVLLRAAGIPTRYVTGYCIKTAEGREVTVYERNAHAWVEYWDLNYGWQIMEATPSDAASDSVEATAPTQTRPPTTRPATTRPTKPTKPAGSTTAQPKKESNPYSLIFWLCVIICAMVGVVLLQAKLRVSRRNYRRKQGNSNERLLYTRKLICKADKVLQRDPHDAVYDLALKARFSAHRINQDELRLVDSHWRDSITQMKKLPWYRRIYNRIILALY